MRQITAILKIPLLLLLLPFETSKGAQKKAYIKIKKIMILAKIL
jgi:hypothetical protein|tara:strand:+ start:232 stop:363 length:132 start_codon:yes stop_codon:yes gene_type:complete